MAEEKVDHDTLAELIEVYKNMDIKMGPFWPLKDLSTLNLMILKRERS